MSKKSARNKYLPRMNIPEFCEDQEIEFYTKGGLLVAGEYERVVFGERGPYIEFHSDHICMDSIFVPEEEKKRLGNRIYYYDEYRTKDYSYVKLYKQKKTVKYADYKIGYWYISPFDLSTLDGELIKPLEKK